VVERNIWQHYSYTLPYLARLTISVILDPEQFKSAMLVLPALGSSDQMALPLRAICSQSFAVFPIFGARRGEDADGSIVARGRFMREESIVHSVELKEAVIYQ
jgi:hypothetical protein